MSDLHQHVRPAGRTRQLDLMRLVFATMVLLAHAPELTDGGRSRELLVRLTHRDITLGAVGVHGFFLLSGFLIVKSWERHPDLRTFLRNRVLRIVPGYLVAVVLSTAAVGWLASGVPHFFGGLGRSFLGSILLLGSPTTPVVFPGMKYQLVNGALWTITYEFRCYLLVALFGLCGLVRRRWLWLAVTAALVVLALSPPIEQHFEWTRLKRLTGDPKMIYNLVSSYFLGGCFYLFRDRIRFRPAGAALAAAGLVLAFLFLPRQAETILVLCGGYLLFYLARAPFHWLPADARFPDISYGVYLYGWPVEALWIWYRHGSPWIAFAGTTVICFLLGWLSWHFVERPMLTLKSKPTAALPPSGGIELHPHGTPLETR